MKLKCKSKLAYILLCCILTVIVLPSNTITVKADTSIGNGAGIYSENESDSPQEPAEKEEAGWAESIFSGMIAGIGDGIQDWLEEDHADLDSIIFGRVGYVKINYFSFDMSKGNPYGLIGSWFYGLVRSIILPMLVFVVLYYFVSAAWDTSGKGRAKFKSNLQKYALVICLLFAAPMILDILVYIKDLILYLVQKGIKNNTTLFNGNVGIVQSYKETYEQYETVFDAVLYVAAVCISLLFAFSYIATALSTTLAYAFFPIVAAMSFSDSKLIGTWLKTMIGNITIPIIDSLLLFIPVVASNIGAPNLVIFGMTIMLLPSRAVIRQLCGLGHGGAAEMLGMGALLATGRMVSSTASRGKHLLGNIRGKHSANKDAKNNQKMYQELANSESANDGTGSIRSSMVAGPMGGQMSGGMDAGRAEIMKKYANASNFENKDFSSILSDQDMSDFYRQRVTQGRLSMGRDIASGVGGMAGMGLGLMATSLYSPAVRATAMDFGGMAGGALAGGLYSANVKSGQLGYQFAAYMDGKRMEDMNSMYPNGERMEGMNSIYPNGTSGETTTVNAASNTSSATQSHVVVDQSGNHTITDNVSITSSGTPTVTRKANVTAVDGSTPIINNTLTLEKVLTKDNISKMTSKLSSSDYVKQLDASIQQMVQKNENMTLSQAKANVYTNAIGKEIDRLVAESNRQISHADRIHCQKEVYGILSKYDSLQNRITTNK